METNSRGLPLTHTYFHIVGDAAEVIEVDDEFWPSVMRGERRMDGWLVASFEMRESPPHAEMHPEGDEILIVTSGRIDVVFEHDAGDEVVTLTAGQACLVPRGVWHRQLVHEPGRLTSLTCGRGTRHRAAP